MKLTSNNYEEWVKANRAARAKTQANVAARPHQSLSNEQLATMYASTPMGSREYVEVANEVAARGHTASEFSQYAQELKAAKRSAENQMLDQYAFQQQMKEDMEAQEFVSATKLAKLEKLKTSGLKYNAHDIAEMRHSFEYADVADLPEFKEFVREQYQTNKFNWANPKAAATEKGASRSFGDSIDLGFDYTMAPEAPVSPSKAVPETSPTNPTNEPQDTSQGFSGSIFS